MKTFAEELAAEFRASQGGWLVEKDGEKHLPTTADGKPDHRLMGAAWAALHGGYRGNKYEGPGKEEAITRLKKLYKDQGTEPPGDSEGRASARPEPDSEIIFRSREATHIFDGPALDGDTVWMPLGRCQSVPLTVNDEPALIYLDVLPEDADLVDRSFRALCERMAPNRPFCDTNHDRDKASAWPTRFYHGNTQQGGVETEAIMMASDKTDLWKQMVGGKIYRSFSPAFGCDAKCTEYDKPGGFYYARAGTRGSKENPARVTGLARDIGSLVNSPGFGRNMPPLWRARRPETAGVVACAVPSASQQTKNGGTTATNNGSAALDSRYREGAKMRVVYTEAHDGHAVGETVEHTTEEAAALLTEGRVVAGKAADEFLAYRAKEATFEQAVKDAKAQRDAVLQTHIDAALKRKAIKKDDAGGLIARAKRWAENDLTAACEYLDAQPGEDVAVADALRSRVTASPQVQTARTGLREAIGNYFRAREPMNRLIREGRPSDAFKLSQETGAQFRAEFSPIFDTEGGDKIRFGEIVDVCRAASTGGSTDTFQTSLGTLAGLLVLPRNLGFLMNKILRINLYSTDFRDEPILYDNWATSRYGVTQTAQYWNGSNWVTPAGVTQNSPTVSGSTTNPSTVDIKVKMDQLWRTWVQFTMPTLSQTLRDLQGEQYPMSLYSLAEAIQNFLFTIFFTGRADDSGAVISYSGLPTNAPGNKGDGTMLIGLPDISPLATPPMIAGGLDLQKIPDMEGVRNRFAILHSIFYRKMTSDTNFVVAEAIANAQRGLGVDVLGTGILPPIQNVDFHHTQMMMDTYQLGVGTQYNDFTQATRIGFVGAKESLVFCGRVPADYTNAFKAMGIDVPPTARIEIVTDDGTGFKVMVVYAVDHGITQATTLASANMLIYSMFGGAVGNPYVGFAVSQK